MKFVKPYSGNRKILPELSAFDFGSSGMKFVRFKRGKRQLAISAVGIDPNIRSGRLLDGPLTLKVPKAIMTRQTVITVSHPSVMVRLIQVPGSAVQQGAVARRIQDQMGLKSDYRFSHCLVKPPKGRVDAEFLVAAMPEDLVQNTLSTFRQGMPAPVFLESSMLSSLKAFAAKVAVDYTDEAVAMVESGAGSIFLALFSAGRLSLVRTFNFGSDDLFTDIEKRFGLGTAQTRAVVSTGNFDVSESITQVLGRFIDQLNLSKDYIERREGTRLENLYISGGLALSPYVGESIQNITSFTVKSWNPLEGCLAGHKVVPENLQGQETRFSAAVGAAFNTLGEAE